MSDEVPQWAMKVATHIWKLYYAGDNADMDMAADARAINEAARIIWEACREQLKEQLNAPPAQMSYWGGLVSINTEGMRKVIDETQQEISVRSQRIAEKLYAELKAEHQQQIAAAEEAAHAEGHRCEKHVQAQGETGSCISGGALARHDAELRERCADIAQSHCSGQPSHSTWCGCEIATEIRHKKEQK